MAKPTRINTSKPTAIRAGFTALLAPWVVRFLEPMMSGGDADTKKVMAWILLGIAGLGFCCAIYVVFTIINHRSILALLLALIGGVMCGAILYGALLPMFR